METTLSKIENAENVTKQDGLLMDKKTYESFKNVIWICDFILEFLKIVVSFYLFYYTDFETKPGFALAVISSFGNLINSYCDLNKY